VFKLLSISGEQSIDLAAGKTLVVGRAVTSDIPIYDPTISRRHAEITLTDAGVRIKDLGSSNGTRAAQESIECRLSTVTVLRQRVAFGNQAKSMASDAGPDYKQKDLTVVLQNNMILSYEFAVTPNPT